MHVIGKKKKGGLVTGAVAPSTDEFAHLFEKALGPPSTVVNCFIDQSGSMDQGVGVEIPWWEQQCKDRGVIILPFGNKMFYCLTSEEMNEIKGARYPDICSVKGTGSAPIMYMSYCKMWHYINPSEPEQLCVGVYGECPHLAHHIEAQKHRAIDSCPNCDEGTCIIVNNLHDKVESRDDVIESLRAKITALERQIEDLKDDKAKLEVQTATLSFKGGDRIKPLQIINDMCLDGAYDGFFSLGEIYTISEVDVDNDRWDLSIKNSEGEYRWVNSAYFIKV